MLGAAQRSAVGSLVLGTAQKSFWILLGEASFQGRRQLGHAAAYEVRLHICGLLACQRTASRLDKGLQIHIVSLPKACTAATSGHVDVAARWQDQVHWRQTLCSLESTARSAPVKTVKPATCIKHWM